MTEMVWKDPPPVSSNRRRNYKPILWELRQNPGRWALLGTYEVRSVVAYLHRLGLEKVLA